MPDDFTPSPCPILDLGVKLPPRDPRDPWRRMPRMFDVCKAVFGMGAMMSHGGPTRSKIEARLGHYCKCTRDTHGACTLRRARLCQEALASEIQMAAFNTDKSVSAYAIVQARITALLRSERHHEALRLTRVKHERTVGEPLRVPPVTLQAMPEDA